MATVGSNGRYGMPVPRGWTTGPSSAPIAVSHRYWMRSRCAGCVEVLHGRAHRHLRVGGAPQRRQPRSSAQVQRSPPAGSC
jgi:hypothetical protein